MKRVVFSKQCDHDLDLAPFWYYWYTEVFEADVIVITPVKTARSQIEATSDFYRSKDIDVIPICFDIWNDEKIWKEQLSLLYPYISDGEDFLAISADTDQFFQPVAEQTQKRELVFRRVHLYSDQTPSPTNLNEVTFSAEPSLDLIAGFVNSLDSTEIGYTGHFDGMIPRSAIPWEFHLGSRGMNKFVEKISNLSVQQDDCPLAGHWKLLRQVFEDFGVEALRDSYPTPQNNTENDLESKQLVDIFVSQANTPSTKSQALLNCPFASQIFEHNIDLEEGEEQESLSIRIPVNEYRLLQNILLEEIFELPNNSPIQRVVDIGAHVGLFSLYCKTYFPDCEIFAFEPVPATFGLLEDNLSNYSNIHKFPIALSNENSELEICTNYFESASDSLKQDAEGCFPSGDFARVFDAGYVFDDLDLDNVDILKISTNGFEPEILASLGERLANVRSVITVFHSHNIRRKIEEALPNFIISGEERAGAVGILKFTNQKHISFPQTTSIGNHKHIT